MLYEAPHHLKKTLKELRDNLGNRKISICRELTKRYEEVVYSDLDSVIEKYEKEDPRGEYVLVIQAKYFKEKEIEEQKKWEDVPLEEHMAFYENQGISRKDAMKAVAKDLGVSKRDIYNKLIK